MANTKAEVRVTVDENDPISFIVPHSAHPDVLDETIIERLRNYSGDYQGILNWLIELASETSKPSQNGMNSTIRDVAYVVDVKVENGHAYIRAGETVTNRGHTPIENWSLDQFEES